MLGRSRRPGRRRVRPDTEAALRELQRGLGLRADGTCGPATLRALGALGRTVAGGDAWALRERDRVRCRRLSLAGKVVVLDPGHGGHDPGAPATAWTRPTSCSTSPAGSRAGWRPPASPPC